MVTKIVIIVPGIGHIARIGIKTITEEGETIVTEEVIGIIGPITEITVGPETGSYRDDSRYDHRSNYRRDDSNQRYSNMNQDHSRSRNRDGRNRSSSRESSQSRSSS